jgi:hypothetical protein
MLITIIKVSSRTEQTKFSRQCYYMVRSLGLTLMKLLRSKDYIS